MIDDDRKKQKWFIFVSKWQKKLFWFCVENNI